MRFISIALFLVFCFSAASIAAEGQYHISGKVVAVSDGDTIKVLTAEKREFKVRLSEIDAPEKDQSYGNASKQALSKLIFGKNVVADVKDIDRYGRSVADVYLAELNVNAEMIKTGMAWVYRQYSKNKNLIELEEQARQSKVGIWSLQEDQRMPPWEWRHNKGASPVHAVPQSGVSSKSSIQVSCGAKRYCKQMNSCQEAMFYLNSCGLSRLDGDHDGVPCESICR